jgi:hypothetical protein
MVFNVPEETKSLPSHIWMTMKPFVQSLRL